MPEALKEYTIDEVTKYAIEKGVIPHRTTLGESVTPRDLVSRWYDLVGKNYKRETEDERGRMIVSAIDAVTSHRPIWLAFGVEYFVSGKFNRDLRKAFLDGIRKQPPIEPNKDSALYKITQNWRGYGFRDRSDVFCYGFEAASRIGFDEIDKITDPNEVFRRYPIEEYRKEERGENEES